MPYVNLNWLADNFSNKNIVVYDIGCANIIPTTKLFKELLNSTVYAFECSEYWKNTQYIDG